MALRDSIVGAITAGQGAVGSALTGGGAAIASNDNGTIPLLEDLRSISRENEGNTQRLTDVLRDMFAFDKTRFQRERDQQREMAKEALQAPAAGGAGGGMGMEDITGGFGAKGLAAIAALAFFAKDMGMNTDILKLPQQLKSMRAMATFAKGIGTIGTLGFGPRIVKDIQLVLGQFGTNIKNMIKTSVGTPILDKFDEFAKFVKNSTLGGVFKSFDTKVLAPIKNFFTLGKGGGAFAGIVSLFDDAKVALQRTFKPIKTFFTGLTEAKGVFGSAGPLQSIIEPIKKFGRFVGKLFLPLTIILGIFDGVSGFMKEYEDTGSIVDGIRGAVVGIIDGFIGTFVRLITDLVGMALEFLGLDNLGKFVTEFGEKITGFFGDAIGGIVDIITGIFTLDFDRILQGFGNLFSGTGNFFLTVLTAPIDMAVNFIKDIFGFGDPEKPFSLIDFFLGEDGPVMGAWNWFKSLFTFDFSSITQRIFDMGRIFKALASGGIAAAKAILPGGESPSEAFTRVYNETINTGRMQDEAMAADRAMGLNPDEFANTDEAKAAEAMRQEILNTNTNNSGGNVVIGNIDNSVKDQKQYATKNESSYNSLNTGIDPYFEKEAWSMG